MTQDIVNNNQSISYTNLDFGSIYTEVLDLVKNLTYRWDPSISDESDPGVILAKLSALVADKCNYNIDKSILEAFPLSVTQDANAQQLYEQLGYYMNWYESAKAPVVLSWISKTGEDNTEVKGYTIPKFTTILVDDEANINYSLIGVEGPDGVVVSDGVLTTDSKELRMVAMEGTAASYTYLNKERVITAQMVDKYTHRIYFGREDVAQNGIFITNTNQNNYADWKRVSNIYEQSYDELRYKFGYDEKAKSCYLEFPDNYSELFGDGIEITYLTLTQTKGDIPAQTLTKFLVPIVPIEDTTVTLDATNVAIQNYAASYGHKEKEEIDEAYKNYKKTVGTFNTLITLRDYLNYIKSQELDICSNAFVCDRTNDIQSIYKIVSKQNDLDSIIVKVEQVIDKTLIESNFDYKFELTADTTVIPGKPYYTVTNDQLSEVEVYIGANPKEQGWYEFVSRVASSHDALEPFSLKFYLLNNSIALDSKQAFNETFELTTKEFDFDYLLEDSAHIQHTFEDILPLGENTYKVTEDTNFLENKAYYIKSNDNINYELFTDYNIGDSTSYLTTTFYEVDVEALLPHIVMFKNIYPLTLEILTYDSLNEKTQEIVQKNVISALYNGLNSSQLNFGEPINISYITEIVKNSDDRIRDIKFINGIDYITKAIYYDKNEKTYKEITLSEDSSNITFDQKDLNSILAKLVEKDIICKSILSGTTQLLIPDDIFSFHLNQKFINYFKDISAITSQAVIDIGGKDALTTYSSETANPYVRQSYTLKPNETISLCRPQLETLREFTSGIHYECFLYNDIAANQSYELQKNEYIIFYQGEYSDSSSITDGSAPSGFSVYACSEGIILEPSFNIKSQTNMNSLTSFARSKVIPNFDVYSDENWYETSTYAYNYVNEIFNNSSIINNSISGTNNVKIQALHSVDIEISDNYKFFWALNTPHYSNDKTLKTYTLFPGYDIASERLADKEKNSYTLKDGEWLYYTDSSFSNLAILGAGTTIYRNCGINAEYDDENPIESFSYININEFNSSGQNPRFNAGILETITSQESGQDVINPKANGWYEKIGEDPDIYERTTDTQLGAKDYYVLVMEDNSGLYKRIGDSEPYEHSSTLQTSNVFSEINLEDYLSNVNPSEKGWYEIVTCMNSRVTDFYALSEGSSYNNYLRYTSSLDDSILSRFIFNHADYQDIDISDVNTYKTITITENNVSAFDYISQRLLVPTDGDNSYKAYYTDSTGETRITGIQIIDNPSIAEYNHTNSHWYEESSVGVFTPTLDTKPVILDSNNSLSYPSTLTEDYCFDEVFIDNWNSIDFNKNGYFYKLNDSESSYTWDPTRNSVGTYLPTNTLKHLLTLYLEGKAKYPFGISTFIQGYYTVINNEGKFFEDANYTIPITGEAGVMYVDRPSGQLYIYENSKFVRQATTNATNIIEYIIRNWKTSIAYQNPFKTDDKPGWRTKLFNEVVVSGFLAEGYYAIVDNVAQFFEDSSHTIPIVAVDGNIYKDKITGITYLYDDDTFTEIEYTHIGIPASLYRSNYAILKSYDCYPKYSINNDNPDEVILPKDILELSSIFYSSTTIRYLEETTSYIEILDRRVQSETVPITYIDIKLVEYISYLYTTFNNCYPDIFCMELQVKPFKFKDLYRMSNKSYFVPNIYVSKTFNKIPPWTCEALDNDEIANDPIKVIADKWQSIQDNTSIRIVQNEVWSFAEGDTLRFEAPVISQNSVVWPRFSNTEIVLDLDSYSISYQRNGASIEDIYKLSLDNYDWRGYSHLLLNTSSKDGQKLESNHSIILYSYNEETGEFDEITTINGSDYENTTFQLRIPVSNVAGKYIDVTSEDLYGNLIYNDVYEFIPLSSSSDLYKYTSDYNTHVYFEVDSDTKNIIDTQVKIPLLLPKGKYLLPIHTSVEGVRYKVSKYMKANISQYISYCTNMSPILSTDTNLTVRIGHNDDGEYLYGYDKDKFVGTSNSNFYMNDTKYHYLDFSIDANPESDEFTKISLPAHLSEIFSTLTGRSATPVWFGWYELGEDGYYPSEDDTSTAEDLLEEIIITDTTNYQKTSNINPNENCWYEKVTASGQNDNDYYILSTDTTVDINKTYYKDKDFYLPIQNVDTIELRINADNPLVSMDSDKVEIVFGDTYKYENNPIFSDWLFNELKLKLRRLDDESLYNYTFTPSDNEKIEDPIVPSSFFKNNHIFNSYIIPQLDFDYLYCTFSPTNMRRR